MGGRLRFDAPLTRLRERNNFRQAILDYQQVRRQQIRYEDGIKLSIRQLLRQLELDERNLETQRRAVIIAIRRVDQTRLSLSQPAPPPPPPSPDGSIPLVDAAAGQLAPTATLNLIYAFNDLRSSQDALTSIWINYYATRASLAYQLGVMNLDDMAFGLTSRLKGLLVLLVKRCRFHRQFHRNGLITSKKLIHHHHFVMMQELTSMTFQELCQVSLHELCQRRQQFGE